MIRSVEALPQYCEKVNACSGKLVDYLDEFCFFFFHNSKRFTI